MDGCSIRLQSVQVELHFFELIIVLVRGRKSKRTYGPFLDSMGDNENPMSKKDQVTTNCLVSGKDP